MYPYYYQPHHSMVPPAQTNDKWYYLTIILGVSFLLSQAWNFYQNKLRTEKKILKIKELIKKQKAQQQSGKGKDKDARQVNFSVDTSAAAGQSDTPAESTSPTPKVRNELDKEKLRNLIKKTNSTIPSNAKNQLAQIKDDLSIFSISRKNSVIEDPMVASAKEREAKSQSKFPITRICLTGGPCAGKTTALATLSLHLKQIGYRVLLVPEAATLLMKGGAMIQTPSMRLSSAVKFQISLMKLQMNLEDIFVDIAQSSDTPTIILCDRGVMDGSAYTDDNVWQAILDETGWSTIQLRDRRYEAVLHMVTAADGAEKFYTQANNEARYEDRQQAVELDKRLINAWVGHPHFSIIQNSQKTFQDKIDQCLSTVLNFIGLPSPSAVVKKFLLIVDKSYHDFKTPKQIKKEFFQVDETFLQVFNEDGSEGTNIVRKIGKNDSFIYSNEIKYVLNQEKIVKKRQITAREYIELLEMKDPEKKQLRKIRQCFIFESQYFMVESFSNVDGSPSLLRIETTDERKKITIPPFLRVLREVTNDQAYQSKHMASIEYRMPEDDKTEISRILNSQKLDELSKEVK